MPVIVQHIPNFVDHREEPPRATVNSMEELLAVEWVARWATDENFHRFSLSTDELWRGGKVRHVMAEQDGGKRWWVVAHIDEHVDWLPEWKPPAKYR